MDRHFPYRLNRTKDLRLPENVGLSPAREAIK